MHFRGCWTGAGHALAHYSPQHSREGTVAVHKNQPLESLVGYQNDEYLHVEALNCYVVQSFYNQYIFKFSLGKQQEKRKGNRIFQVFVFITHD